MPAPRTIVLGALTAAVVVAGGAVAVTALDDPDGSAAPVDISDRSAADLGEPAREGANRQVPGLEELSGTVTTDDDHGRDDVVDDLEIDGVDLDFGPDDWVATAEATDDFDGDGTVEALRDELAGLVGREVTLLVRFDDDGDDADVYVIDGRTYRDVSAPAPWLPPGSAADEDLQAAAAAAVGEGAEVIELDPEDDGDVAWEAKVRAADGTLREVLLDAEGNVVDVHVDD
jgi:hypothetical protein